MTDYWATSPCTIVQLRLRKPSYAITLRPLGKRCLRATWSAWLTMFVIGQMAKQGAKKGKVNRSRFGSKKLKTVKGGVVAWLLEEVGEESEELSAPEVMKGKGKGAPPDKISAVVDGRTITLTRRPCEREVRARQDGKELDSSELGWHSREEMAQDGHTVMNVEKSSLQTVDLREGEKKVVRCYRALDPSKPMGIHNLPETVPGRRYERRDGCLADWWLWHVGVGCLEFLLLF